MNRRSLIAWLIFGVFAVVMVLRHWPASQDSPRSINEVAAIPITAEALHAAYLKNEVAAEDKYKGKIVTVSGGVHSILTFGEQPVVNLFGSDGRGGVQCYFDKGQREEVANIERGEQATFKCKCDGFYDDVVLATECVVQSHRR